ncbi:hypothetical protein [Kocuria sp. cx-455]|uniref:hypothetical protein n=1 Tax=Kocuria sp. cx-455 TaxID=2771377 RepID=UPI003D7058F7
MTAQASSSTARALRTAGAVLCGLLTGVAFAAWLGLTWVQDHVLSPSGFEDTARSIVTDTSFQTELVGTVLDRATFGLLDDYRTGLDPVDQALEDVRERAVDAAESFATAPEQQGMWTEVLVRTHAANVPLSPELGNAPENLVVDVSPVGATLDQRIRDTIGIDPALNSQGLTVTVPGARTGPAIDALVWIAQWRFVLPWLAAVLGIATLLVAPHRWLALVGLGLAGLVMTGALLITAMVAAQAVTSASSVEPVAHLMVTEIVGLLRESFVARCVTGMTWVAVVALVGVTGAVVRRYAVAYH